MIENTRRSELLVDCMPMLRAYVRRLVKDREAANDVLQEASLRILVLADAPDGDHGRFHAWSRGVARLVALRELRGHRRRGEELRLGDSQPEPKHPMPDPERHTDVCRKLAMATVDLDGGALELLARRYLLEETPKELAAELDESPAAMRMRLMRLRSRLRALD
jgi:RNA polymerase sigma factor (sigma-70 family)